MADRAIFLTLQPIPEEHRRSEKELWAAFEKVRPQILGTLLDAVSHGLRRLPDTTLESLPRMADFALWATACEGAVWDEGAFKRAYMDNLDEAVDTVIEGDLVASAVRSLMGSRAEWTGTATQLLDIVSEQVGETARKTKSWPATANVLSGRLRRAATFLRKVGIDISFDREGRARTRTIWISSAPDNVEMEPSAPSAPSARSVKTAPGNDSTGAPLRTVRPSADANGTPADHATVREKHSESGAADGEDGEDAKTREQSGGWRVRL